MNKIVFIEPKSPNLHIFSQYPLPRLGIFILGAIAKEKGWNVEVIIEQSQKVDFEKIKKQQTILTCILRDFPKYAILDEIKKKFKK